MALTLTAVVCTSTIVSHHSAKMIWHAFTGLIHTDRIHTALDSNVKLVEMQTKMFVLNCLHFEVDFPRVQTELQSPPNMDL